MLERSAGKLARSVLRGLGEREPTWLPGGFDCPEEVVAIHSCSPAKKAYVRSPGNDPCYYRLSLTLSNYAA
jgi:hypothetical protein